MQSDQAHPVGFRAYVSNQIETSCQFVLEQVRKRGRSSGGKIKYPKYYKNSNEYCTFLCFGRLVPQGRSVSLKSILHLTFQGVFSYFHGQKKNINLEFLQVVKFTLKKIINMKMRKRLDQNRLLKHLVQSNIDARVNSQCFQYLEYTN